ncbi:MAG: flippase-like domain-containing protein, partial [Polyangiales bacterium]
MPKRQPTQGDVIPQRAEEVSSELLRKAGVVTVVAIVIYSVVLALADYQSIEVSVQKLPFKRIVLALGLATASFGVRFLRWQGYLRTLEIRTSLPNSALIFTSGLGMSITPGKAGEVLKALMLQQVTGTPVARSVPIVAAERVTDAMALLVLGAVGLLDLAIGPVVLALAL